MNTSQKYQQLNKLHKTTFVATAPQLNPVYKLVHDEAFNQPIANVLFNFSNN